MPVRAFAVEDGNINTKTLISSRAASYLDIDLAFAPKPAGDLYKKAEAAAVKQAVKNLLMTNQMEKPFDTTFGGNLNDFLFELDTTIDVNAMADQIIESVELHEPRARILDIDVTLNNDNNEIKVSIQFQVLTTQQVVELELSLARLR
jgi:phage baseplate assembly protein W